MRRERMTEVEYIQIKIEIEKIKEKITLLREEKKKLINRVRWYEYTEQNKRKDYTKTFAFQMFGKRLRDLTEDEKKEYGRERTRISRENK